MKALIVEDSPVYQQVIRHTLEKLGFTVDLAVDGAGAMTQIQENRFDLIVLDMHLPDQNGLELCRRVRVQSANRLVPVLMLTSDDSSLLTQRALDAGVTELFRKSKLAELHEMLADYIGRMQRQFKGRVLLVEDSPTTAELLKYMLKKLALEVDHFDTGEAALEVVASGKYDLIVSDIVLAGQITGLGIVRAVRALEGEVCRTPILGLSALEDAARKIEMLRLGANDYVAKPVIEEEFAARVGNLVASKQLLDQVQQQRRELRERSIRDALTGLYNRHYLAEVSAQLFANADRSQRPVSLMMVDIDHFKKINDTYGHDVGDKVLAGVGKLLAADCRQGDVAARFGGEEFVILLPDCSEEAATQRAERLLEDLRGLKPADIPVTASIGVGAHAQATQTFDQLFKRADEAVYEAKQTGRNKVVTAKAPA